MHLDQLIRALQHPECIDAADAANLEVEFRTGGEEGLGLQGVRHINGRICVDLRPVNPPRKIDDKNT